MHLGLPKGQTSSSIPSHQNMPSTIFLPPIKIPSKHSAFQPKVRVDLLPRWIRLSGQWKHRKVLWDLCLFRSDRAHPVTVTVKCDLAHRPLGFVASTDTLGVSLHFVPFMANWKRFLFYFKTVTIFFICISSLWFPDSSFIPVYDVLRPHSLPNASLPSPLSPFPPPIVLFLPLDTFASTFMSHVCLCIHMCRHMCVYIHIYYTQNLGFVDEKNLFACPRMI